MNLDDASPMPVSLANQPRPFIFVINVFHAQSKVPRITVLPEEHRARTNKLPSRVLYRYFELAPAVEDGTFKAVRSRKEAKGVGFVVTLGNERCVRLVSRAVAGAPTATDDRHGLPRSD